MQVCPALRGAMLPNKLAAGYEVSRDMTFIDAVAGNMNRYGTRRGSGGVVDGAVRFRGGICRVL